MLGTISVVNSGAAGDDAKSSAWSAAKGASLDVLSSISDEEVMLSVDYVQLRECVVELRWCKRRGEWRLNFGRAKGRV